MIQATSNPAKDDFSFFSEAERTGQFVVHKYAL
jgi:hypothetical protein